MKKYITNILLFFAIVAMIDLCVGYFGDYLQAHAKGGVTMRINDIAMKDCHDVVVLGSSRAHHHYDTPFLSDSLKFDVYNAGFDGNGIVLGEGLLELILERYRPQLIIYDVEPSFDILEYDNDNHCIRYINNLKPYYRHQAINELINDVSKEEWYKVHSGLIRYNSNLITLFLDNVRATPVEPYGFLPSVGQYNIVLTEKKRHNENHATVDELKLKYIEKLINAAQKNGISLIFVASPKYGAASSEELQPVKDICKNNNVEFLDYYTSEEFQNNIYFKEPMHLNGTGARIFTKEILNQIIKNKYVNTAAN